MRDRKTGGRSGIADVVGVMFVASGVGDAEWENRAAFGRQREDSAGVQPFRHRLGDALQIAEIDQTIAA